MTAQSDFIKSSPASRTANMKPEGSKSGKRVRCSESRKIRKPLMEKRRRARINQSLNELKRILLEANGAPPKKEGSRPAKLEKADILELTVRHLQSLHQQSSPKLSPQPCPSSLIKSSAPLQSQPPSPSSPPSVSQSENSIGGASIQPGKPAPMSHSQWLTGFKECIRMVSSSLHTLKSEESPSRCTTSPLLCLDSDSCPSRVSPPESPDVLRDLASLSDKFLDEDDHRVPCVIRPSRLPNGDIAFVIKYSSGPSSSSHSPSMYSHSPKVKVEAGDMSPKCSPSMYPSPSFYSSNEAGQQQEKYVWRPW